MGGRWLGLHDAAGVVAALAGLPAPTVSPEARNFPQAIAQAGGWRLVHAREGVADLAAILETGIRALLAVHARGTPAAVPARALWDEFVAARDALLALAPPGSLERRPIA
ncbi:hypothetical protein H7F51_03675 [Novosphingobium flavum]|uniref:Uncharacterized protein n=1 Tax=Novosphingobium flavum TaxID=1778672 RepID=A0A7X1KKL1_9SPHN|nr:hypothetical protein [Novosphingobium flavum]